MLIREQNENAEEWMGHLRHKANEWCYKEGDRRPKEPFINGIKDEALMMEIIKVLTAIKETNKVTGEQVLWYAK